MGLLIISAKKFSLDKNGYISSNGFETIFPLESFNELAVGIISCICGQKISIITGPLVLNALNNVFCNVLVFVDEKYGIAYADAIFLFGES